MKKTLLFGVMIFLLVLPTVFANSPPQLTEGGAQPAVATPNTTIVYRVTYIDEDGDAPLYVRLIFPTGTFGTKEMEKSGGNYRTGAVYEYRLKQDDSSDYRFEANDGNGISKLPGYGGTFAPVNIISEELKNNKIYFFSNGSSTPIWSFDVGEAWVQNVAISDDGKYVAAKAGKHIYLFSKESPTPLWTYQCDSGADEPSGGNGGADLSADGNYIVGGCQDSLSLFSRESKIPIWTYKEGIGIYAVSISADGEYLAAGTSFSDELIFFSKKNNEPLWKYQATSDVHGLSVSSDGKYIAAGSHSPEEIAYLFLKESNAPITKYKTSPDSPVWTAAMSRDGKYTAYGLDSADTYTSIFLFSNDKNTPLKAWTTDWWVRSVDMSSNGKYLVAGSGDHNVYLIDKDKDWPLWKFEAGERVGSVSISQDGNYIAAGSKDKNVYLLSKESKIPLWGYKTDSWVASVAISANGTYLVAGTGAAQYMSEGHHSTYNPEKHSEGEIERKEEGAEENFEREAVCGDTICIPKLENSENCPQDCISRKRESGDSGIEKGVKESFGEEKFKEDKAKEVVCGNNICEPPAESENNCCDDCGKCERNIFDKMINFFKALFGK